VLPGGSTVKSVRLDGKQTGYRIIDTARGREVVADGGHRPATSTLEVWLG
jgi:hypothetical protein